MTLPADVEKALLALVDRHTAEHCLLLAPDERIGPELLARFPSPVTLNKPFSPQHDLRDRPRVRLAVVVDSPDVLGRQGTLQLLAWLRNIGAHAVVAAFARPDPADDQAGDWSRSDFLGLGFRRAEQARDLTSAYWLYRYNIYDYKITPDWLNSRHWANPGRWDEERW